MPKVHLKALVSQLNHPKSPGLKSSKSAMAQENQASKPHGRSCRPAELCSKTLSILASLFCTNRQTRLDWAFWRATLLEIALLPNQKTLLSEVRSQCAASHGTLDNYLSIRVAQLQRHKRNCTKLLHICDCTCKNQTDQELW